MNIQDRKKSLTAEELRQRYNLDGLNSDRQAIQLVKNGLSKTDTELNQFVETTTKNIKDLQDQVDGNITTWFFNGIPTMENKPAVDWTTDEEKGRHIGDLYYDQDTGYAYRFYIDGDTHEFGWSKIVDADVVEALAVANSAKDTADSKRRVFVVQPIPPYDVGDMWTDGTDLYRCRAANEEGTFSKTDWILATNYTDDTVALSVQSALNDYKVEVEENYASQSALETTINSVDARVNEVYTQTQTVTAEVDSLSTPTKLNDGNNNVYISDGQDSDLIEYHIEGKSVQDGTPTPTTPKEIKTIPFVKNLANFGEEKRVSLGLTTTIEKDTFTINGTSTNGGTYCSLKTVQLIKKGTYTLYTQLIDGNIERGSRSYQFLIDKVVGTTQSTIKAYNANRTDDITTLNLTDDCYIVIRCYINGADAKYNNLKIRVMLESGNEAHEFVNYSENQYLKIKTKGKNLFNYLDYINDCQINSDGSLARNTDYGTSYLRVESGKTYVLSNDVNRQWVYTTTKQFPFYGVVGKPRTVINSAKSIVVTIPEGDNFLCFRHTYSTPSEANHNKNVMVDLGEKPSDYETYKERITTIDLTKPELFNKNDAEILNAALSDNGTLVAGSSNRTAYIQCKNNTTYTISKIGSKYFRVAEFLNVPKAGSSYISRIKKDGTANTEVSFTTTTGNYLAINYFSNDTIPEQDILDSIKIHEGYSPYYELNSIGDVKDTLDIVNGKITITKNIGKIILDGSESWAMSFGTGMFNIQRFVKNAKANSISSHFIFNTVQSGLYNVLKDGEFGLQINTDDNTANIMMKKMNITTSTNFKTWLSSNNVVVYYELAQPETITLEDNNITIYDGISNVELQGEVQTKTKLIYYRKTPLSEVYTNQTKTITRIENSVNASINTTNANIQIINETLQNGVSKVRTEKDYTFDKEGLKITSSERNLQNKIDETGMYVKNTNTNTNMLVANQDGVEATNLKAKTFIILNPYRLEKTTAITDNSVKGIGFFYIGDDE